MIMIMGYGVIAVPTGILGAEISNASNTEFKGQYCSNCGVRFYRAEVNFCHECGTPQEKVEKKQGSPPPTAP